MPQKIQIITSMLIVWATFVSIMDSVYAFRMGDAAHVFPSTTFIMTVALLVTVYRNPEDVTYTMAAIRKFLRALLQPKTPA